MLVKFFATYREITKCASCEVVAPLDLSALFSELGLRFGPALPDRLLSDDGQELAWDAVVLVNGRHIMHLAGLKTPLRESDTVAIFPLMAGG